jgi:integration host factor subunit alpha|tara:strand:- start:142 stop:522 length:381 start_codon:yes stop_codon:yes gene_type:complete
LCEFFYIEIILGGLTLKTSESYEYDTVVKADLVERVYEKVGFTRQEAMEAVEIILNEIKIVLARGEDVRISGFAGFHLREKNARTARNPRSGEPVRIRARRVLTFKPSKQLLISTNRLSDEFKDTR